MRQCSSGTVLVAWGAWQNQSLDPHMQGKINVKIEIKQRDELNQTIEK